jgi:hypothetical protein
VTEGASGWVAPCRMATTLLPQRATIVYVAGTQYRDLFVSMPVGMLYDPEIDEAA